MKKEKIIFILYGLINVNKLIEEDNDIENKLISNGYSLQEIKEYFQVKRDFVKNKINKRNNGLLSISSATTVTLIGLNTQSDARIFFYTGATALLINGSYSLIKKNKYSSKMKTLNKKYNI